VYRNRTAVTWGVVGSVIVVVAYWVIPGNLDSYYLGQGVLHLGI
jgi:hypothetical protein